MINRVHLCNFMSIYFSISIYSLYFFLYRVYSNRGQTHVHCGIYIFYNLTYLMVFGGQFSILNDFLESIIRIGIEMRLLLVICQCLYCSLFMLAAGEMS